MYLITGATGHTGTVAAETLLSAGKKVRLFVRDAAKASRLAARGAEIAVGDLADPAALGQAARGAEGVFLLSPPDLRAKDFLAERKALTQAQVNALAKEKVPHVVLLSSLGAEHAAGTGPIVSTHNAEEQLRAAGLSATFVRAGFFIENWASVIPVAQKDGVLPSFIPGDLAAPMVDTRDIGKTLAEALLEGPRGTRVIELGGPQDVTPRQVAAALGKILGKNVALVEPPLDAVVPTFTSFGMSENIAGLFREMYQAMRDGKIGSAGGEKRRGTISLEDSLKALIPAT